MNFSFLGRFRINSEGEEQLDIELPADTTNYALSHYLDPNNNLIKGVILSALATEELITGIADNSRPIEILGIGADTFSNDNCLTELLQALRQNNTVRELHLPYLSDNQFNELTELLGSNNNITTLTISLRASQNLSDIVQQGFWDNLANSSITNLIISGVTPPLQDLLRLIDSLPEALETLYLEYTELPIGNSGHEQGEISLEELKERVKQRSENITLKIEDEEQYLDDGTDSSESNDKNDNKSDKSDKENGDQDNESDKSDDKYGNKITKQIHTDNNNTLYNNASVSHNNTEMFQQNPTGNNLPDRNDILNYNWNDIVYEIARTASDTILHSLPY